jgi:CDP-diacylglycerol pyrophosphatase
VADTKVSELVAGAVAAPKPGDRLAAAMKVLESTPMYWIFRNSAGILWVLATGQAAARAAVGDHTKDLALVYQSAGLALRAAEMQSERLKVPILNLPALETAALADPEPDNGAKTAWAARKKLGK